MLDGSQNSLRYCLFATTTEDYEKHIKQDESLERRLQVIHIKPLDKDNLLHMLHLDADDMAPLLPGSLGVRPSSAQAARNLSKRIYERDRPRAPLCATFSISVRRMACSSIVDLHGSPSLTVNKPV
jgi:hypothetical protein